MERVIDFLIQLIETNTANFIVAGIGALAGAWGAWKIADRKQQKDDYVKEIRAINTAMTLTFSVCNDFLVLKSQHVKPLKEDFDKTKQKLIGDIERFQAGKVAPGFQIRFEPNLKAFESPQSPIELLESYVYGKLNLPNRALMLMNQLNGSYANFKDSCVNRNGLIQTFFHNGVSPEQFYGLPQKHGIDSRYADYVEAQSLYCDDIIYFSSQLNVALRSAGEKSQAKNKRLAGKGAQELNLMDLAKAEQDGLMPDPKKYEKWESGFVARPIKLTKWQRLKAWYSKICDDCKPPNR